MKLTRYVNLGITAALLGGCFGYWAWQAEVGLWSGLILVVAMGLSWFLLSSVMFNSLLYFSQRVFLVPFVLTQSAMMASAEVVVFHFARPNQLVPSAQYSLCILVVGGFCFMAFALQGLLIYIRKVQDRYLQDQQRVSLQQQLAHEAGIQELQYKFQPHFLYNSLNTINALVGIDAKRARNMIINLSDLLRRSVTQAEAPLHPLLEEIKVLRQYLAIEQERFGDRLVVDIAIAPELELMPIPPFLLQPVLENAIKYGLYGTLEQVLISLEVTVQTMPVRMGVIKVVNPFSDEDRAGQPDGTRSGLRILARRLGLIYGRSDLLSAKADQNKFVTLIKIPF